MEKPHRWTTMQYTVFIGLNNCDSESYPLTRAGDHKPNTPTVNSDQPSITVYLNKYGANGPVYSLKRLPHSLLCVYDKALSQLQTS
jgi:hypothetical protein